MSKVKDAIAEHCERYCVPECDSCVHDRGCDFSHTLGGAACGTWECGRDDATCYADAVASEADRIHDAVKDGDAV